MHLFIDTNILLSFYHLTNDDLEELKKLAVLMAQKTVTLHVTDQVVAEFTRNRESKIADAVKKLKEQHLNLQFPQVCKDYPEYQQLRELQKQYDAAHSNLLTKLLADVLASKLRADVAISELFNAATHAETDAETVSKARVRIDIGNSPGKNGSLGDAINWELLLKTVPHGTSLYFVSEDRDYTSTLDETKFKNFLQQEWRREKAGEIIFYKRLSSFFKDIFPAIKLASELEKDLVIQQLVASPNFSTTHTAVAKLEKYADFSVTQASNILLAATINNQVGWIATDPDMKQFLESILTNYNAKVEPDLVAQVEELLAPTVAATEENNDDIPF
jgi:predicted nucleic acid-binding protein